MSLFLEIEAMVRKLIEEGADLYNEEWEIICGPGAYRRLQRERRNPLGIKLKARVDEILPDGDVRIMRR